MGCEYKLLVQLKLRLNGRRSIEIRSKADEKLPFLQWINRVLYDYVLKYPYSLKEITEVRREDRVLLLQVSYFKIYDKA